MTHTYSCAYKNKDIVNKSKFFFNWFIIFNSTYRWFCMRAFLYQNHPLFLLLVHGIKYINNKSKHKYLQIIIKTICHHQFLLFFMDVFSHFIFHFHYFQHINKSFCSYNSSFLIFFLSPVCF